jgi:hypothetical protein
LAAEPTTDESALVARIAGFERMNSAAAAGQARVTADLDAVRRASEAAAGVPAGKRGRGLASEIALARRDSPARGGRHLGLARVLVHDMPHTLAALQTGVLSEWRATLIVRAESERTVTIRPAPDTMTHLSALLPMTQGVGVYAALRKAADTCGDGRGRGQSPASGGAPDGL